MKAISIALFYLLSCSLLWSQEVTPDLSKQADELYAQREDISKAQAALDLYLKLTEQRPQNIDLRWKTSMALYYIGHHLPKNKKKQRRQMHQRGLDQAKECDKLAQGTRVECVFWLATNLALLKQDTGMLTMAFGIKDILKEFERALKLDPLYAGAGPYRMLGLLYYKAPGFLGGDEKKSFEYLEQAIKIAPNEPLNYLFLAKNYLDEKNHSKAQEIVNNAMTTIDAKKLNFYESKKAYEDLKNFKQYGKWKSDRD